MAKIGHAKGSGGGGKKLYGISQTSIKRGIPTLLKLVSPSLSISNKKALVARSPNNVVNLLCQLLDLCVKLKLKKQLGLSSQRKLRECLMKKGAYFKYVTNFKHPLRLRKKVLLGQRGSGFGLIPLALSAIIDPILKAILPAGKK